MIERRMGQSQGEDGTGWDGMDEMGRDYSTNNNVKSERTSRVVEWK